jgi:hypothetical protein
MANKKHVAELIKERSAPRAPTLAWNACRKVHTDIVPDLSKADLVGAYLGEANLSGVDLREADLRGADLKGADLSRQAISRSDMGDQTTLVETIFADTNLTGAKGLEDCLHRGPSVLDHRTLQKSGPLPLKRIPIIWKHSLHA